LEIESRNRMEDDLRKLFDSCPGKVSLQRYLQNPKNNCYNAALAVIQELRGEGWETKTLGALHYENQYDTFPSNHYATLAIRDGVELVVDYTMHQCGEMVADKPFIGSLSDWKKSYRSLGDNVSQTIVCKVYSSLTAAEREIGHHVEFEFGKSPFFHSSYEEVSISAISMAPPANDSFPITNLSVD
jgi:hypothetical protein